MKLKTNGPFMSLVRWFVLRKNMARLMPSMMRYGGWLPMAFLNLIGIKALLLTTTGRKTGKPRMNPITYVRQGDDYLISAHHAGHNTQPHWYLNLLADPNVTVELFWKRRSYYAEPITDEEERKALMPQFSLGLVEAAQGHTPEPIPVIRLRPVQAAD